MIMIARLARLALMRALLLALSTVLAGTPGWGQSGDADGIGVADRKGFFYSVTNRPGPFSYIQVTKLTLQGTVMWSVPYQLPVDITATAITVDEGGSVIVAGTVKDKGQLDVLVVKFTSFGAPFGKRIHDARHTAIPTIVAADSAKNFYVAATLHQPSGGTKVLMLRYDLNLSPYWAQEYQIGRTNYARFLALDRQENAIVSIDVGSDPRSGYYQTRQVMFTVYGGVVPL